ncbi:MAG: hypothetical protein K6U04_12580 [Armatimonadetes bacterium]|nr:hypothetical protein [Armatimonadota bacterium]
MHALTYQIRLLEPLLLRSPGSGEENSGFGLSFIPGSVVRGFLIGRYLKANRVVDPAADPSFRRLFLAGAVRYLHAYPVNRHGRRALPCPLSWRVAKDEAENPAAEIYDLAAGFDQNGAQVELPKGEFCWILQEEDEVWAELASPRRCVSLHNAGTDRMVKRKEDSTVFRYEALAPGQTFGGVILADSEEDVKILEQLLAKREALLGGSRQAGYGLVRFEKVGKAPPAPGWREFEEGSGRNGNVVVTLLSDAILCGPGGQVSPDPLYLLGTKPEKAFLKVRLAGGFNRKWELPLPQALALQAGSVFVYRANEIDEKYLTKVIKEGVGERRVEGFGRLAVNWPAWEKLLRREAGKKDDSTTVGELAPESRLLAERMAERLLRNRLEEKLMQAVNQLAIGGYSPSNAQLSRLRLAVRQAWRENDKGCLVRYLDRLRRPAREQLEKARVGNKPMLEWLREDVSRDLIWEEYICLQPGEIPAVAGIKADAETLKIEYTMRLLEGLLKKEIRTKRVGGGGK